MLDGIHTDKAGGRNKGGKYKANVVSKKSNAKALIPLGEKMQPQSPTQSCSKWYLHGRNHANGSRWAPRAGLLYKPLVLLDCILVSCSFYEIFQVYKKGQKSHSIENKHNINTQILSPSLRNSSAHKVESACAFFLGGAAVSFSQRGPPPCWLFPATTTPPAPTPRSI